MAGGPRLQANIEYLQTKYGGALRRGATKAEVAQRLAWNRMIGRAHNYWVDFVYSFNAQRWRERRTGRGTLRHHMPAGMKCHLRLQAFKMTSGSASSRNL